MTTERALEIAGVRVTHPDRVLYAGQGITKRDLADYYAAVADWILPHLVSRPIGLIRCPRGQGQSCFFQRHAGSGMPAAVRRVRIPEEQGRVAVYLAVDDAAGLLSLVQLGVLEFHPWGARADQSDRPDRLIFDLDPAEGLAWERVVAAAQEVRTRLADLGLTSFVKTTGGKGLHVVLPLARRHSWEEARRFAQMLAERMAAERPDAFTSSAAKAARPGKIFIDYLRNARGASAVAPYSTRAKPGAPVATPLAWEELDAGARPDGFTLATLPDRLARLGDPRQDPWAPMRDLRQSITAEARRRLTLN